MSKLVGKLVVSKVSDDKLVMSKLMVYRVGNAESDVVVTECWACNVGPLGDVMLLGYWGMG